MGIEEGALFILRRAGYLAEAAPLNAAAETDPVTAHQITIEVDEHT
jgi:hypothetical protein